MTAATLGDLDTLDPCSLADPAAFGASASASFGDGQSLDYCVLELAQPTGPIEVHIGEVVTVPGSSAGDGSPSPRGAVQMPGGLRLEQGRPGSTSCQDELALAAGHARHRTYPAHSFGPVDACRVLTQSILKAAVPKLAGAQAVPHPAGHQCEYGASGTSSTYAALILAAAYARFDGGPGSMTLSVAGHEVVLVPDQPDARSGECVGYGPHIPFPSRSGQAAMEMAELHVALPAGSTDAAACADVRALARTVFARLP